MTERATQADIAFQAQLYSDPNPTRRGLHTYRSEWVIEHASPYLKPGVRALEVGVGCGVMTRELAAYGANVSAVDINPDFLAGISDIPGVSDHRLDATEPLNLGNFEVAICSEVLEHVPPHRSEALLTSIFDALTPGGILVLSTPQRFSTVELVARLFRYKPILSLARKLYGSAEELGHINLLTAEALKSQIERVGFEVIGMERFGAYLPVVAEFGGNWGKAALDRLGAAVAPVPGLRGALWTQGWVLKRPG